MNRKLSVLAAGLALSAALTGCTSTAGYRTIPGTVPDRYNGQYEFNRGTATNRYRVDRDSAGRISRNSTTTKRGYIGTDGRWHPYAGTHAGIPRTAGTPIASYPNPNGML